MVVLQGGNWQAEDAVECSDIWRGRSTTSVDGVQRS